MVISSGEMQMSYLDNMEARLEMVDRISSLDLRARGRRGLDRHRLRRDTAR